MLRPIGRPLAGLVLSLLCGWSALADKPSPPSAKPSPAKHTLRYKFRPGETLKWRMEQRLDVEATISGNTLTTQAFTGQVKVWRIKEVAADGSATLENSVEEVDMRQKLTGRAEVRYNSKTDKKPPLGFENVAQSIGLPLSRVQVDAQGKVLKREHLLGSRFHAQLTVLLPDQSVAVGETWTVPGEVAVPTADRMIKKIKTLQTCTLLDVVDGVATIRVATQVLTPIRDPAVEIQTVHLEAAGTVRLDIAAGRILTQRMDADKTVFGFSGAASSYHYREQLTEKLLDAPGAVAEAKPQAPASKAAVPDKKAPEGESKAAQSEPKLLGAAKKTAQADKKPADSANQAADAPRPLPGNAQSAKRLEAVVPEPKRPGGTRR